MRILCIGDVVGSVGCNFLRKHLHSVKKLHGVDLVICNGENSADGNGITPVSAQHLFTSGVDVITLGNHSFRRKEAYEMIENEPYIVRPANFPPVSAPGKGITHVDMGRTIVTVINIMGNSHMENTLRCPFETMDNLLKQECGRVIIVDFHGETTSEKRAMGFYLDGKVSAVFGTHTHVQTADAQVLPKGTGYITDVGMTGTIQSILGVKPEIIIEKFRSGMPARFDLAQGDCRMDCVLFEIDEKTGKCISAEHLSVRD
ncbi:MAG TPA: TIGR00282 family metallophosphoesterase [Candidatus Limousia pullorum]|uniref:TIGR00282 family metallophosphoesterase n=1 Tax=Candidatus Limousia pullorum TaxID=2840860 RepID=A0A9D1LWW7_9FIRM|nr:TIGR00282 family metallophosphoesterase [Anaeromassilibacillus sp. An172]OUP76736.1 metallophosphoesterase [Anaeromassilibacillus sp. An172]HIU49559.1 TIGR00282 family metallophosphoesterase [Candidatus Limousia pullorum]